MSRAYSASYSFDIPDPECRRCTTGAKRYDITLPDTTVIVEYVEYFAKKIVEANPGATMTVVDIAVRPV